MKRFSKLLSLVMVLAMVFSLCGCGSAAKKVVGIWGLDCDFSKLLADEMGDEYADFNCEFPMTILFDFKDDETFLMSVDKDAFSTSLDKWFDEFIAFNVDLMYAQFEDMGVDKAAADEEIQKQFGCSMEEYMRALVAESMNADDLTSEMTKDGTYAVKGNKIFLAEAGEDLKTIAGNSFEVTADTLTIKMADEEDSKEIIPGLTYPLTLNKIQ